MHAYLVPAHCFLCPKDYLNLKKKMQAAYGLPGRPPRLLPSLARLCTPGEAAGLAPAGSA